MSQELLNGLLVAQVIMGIILITFIMLQNRTEGMGQLFGGGGGGEHFRTRRGLESFLYYATVFFIIAFAVNSFVIVKYSG